jgi:hypothetical protein
MHDVSVEGDELAGARLGAEVAPDVDRSLSGERVGEAGITQQFKQSSG